MKIGILAYQSAINFGANLQLASTFGYLKKHGHEPFVINLIPDDLEQFYASSFPEQVAEHREFMNTYCTLTEKCKDAKEVAEIIKELNIQAVIIGSDAVAQHHPLLERLIFPTRKLFRVNKLTSDRMFPNPFWGTFSDYLSPEFPMAIMSASNQDSSFRWMGFKTRKEMRKRLDRMCYISARDVWTQQMYHYIYKNERSILITPDPVFAFNQNVDKQPKEDEVRSKFGLDRDYILLSFLKSDILSVSWFSEFERLANLKGIDCVALPFPSGIKFDNTLKKKINLPLSPIDWYCLIKYSKGYVGNNMHPIVVSLHNATPFYSFDNYGRFVNKYQIDDSTSKIKHILGEANMSEYRLSTNTCKTNPPKPDYILTKLLEFERDRVLLFSSNQYQAYDKMLQVILEKFTQKAI